jgi:hypothetical protein
VCKVLLVCNKSEGEGTRRLLDQNELQHDDFAENVTLDGLAFEIANILTMLHSKNILVRIQTRSGQSTSPRLPPPKSLGPALFRLLSEPDEPFAQQSAPRLNE